MVVITVCQSSVTYNHIVIKMTRGLREMLLMPTIYDKILQFNSIQFNCETSSVVNLSKNLSFSLTEFVATSSCLFSITNSDSEVVMILEFMRMYSIFELVALWLVLKQFSV